MWKRIGTYLGLIEEYDDEYAELPEESLPSRAPETARMEPSNVRRIAPSRQEPPGEPTRPLVQPVPSSKVHITDPTTFNDVEEVGDRFRNGIPVIMNLAGASEPTAKRLLDFASGLIYGLDGRIERVGDRVFLLTPLGTEVSTEERRRLTEGGFFNQA
ncbi:MAG TPA: cell division protein SepF [Egibacteraceae bacterium]|nr:cell division protein SepF [Egibacteraceae bacterium]